MMTDKPNFRISGMMNGVSQLRKLNDNIMTNNVMDTTPI